MLTRRRLLQALGAAGALTALGGGRAAAQPTPLTRPIPTTGEALPVIGMGSSRTFDVQLTAQVQARLSEVLELFFAHQGAVIDSSPMYGRAESVLGELLAGRAERERLFAATKVWTDGRDEGLAQMQRSEQRMGVARFDLIQIHNLRDWRTHLDTLREWKARERIRYLGVTTSHGRYHDELETLLEREAFDFVQLSYSLGNREAEQRLLPLAAARGVAVIVNRPFQRGALFRAVRGRELPAWAADYEITSWAQLFLKYAVSHPAVTCAIPATSKPRHMRDNMGANFGPMPDAAARRRMERLIDAI